MSNELKLIIGIDGWTAGSRHFERLVPAFEEMGYRLILIHVGSWGHDVGRPKEEWKGQLLVRDISYYEGKSIPEIFSIERPSAVLFLSTRSFVHMAFNRYAKFMEIPSCHLYHGVVAVQAYEKGQAFRSNFFRRLALLRDRIFKNIFLIIPLYARCLMQTSAPLSCWIDLFTEPVSKLVNVGHGQRVLRDTTTDIGCVYIEADVDHMIRTYRVDRNNIFVVGNPDIASFDMHDSDFMAQSLENGSERREIIYIETALLAVGSVFSSADEFIDHLEYCRALVNSAGYDFVVKLHPATELSDLPARLNCLGFALCPQKSFVMRLRQAAAAISEPSSAGLIPALIGLPLLLCQLGKLAGQEFGAVLRNYPRSRFLSNARDLPSTLTDIKVSDDRGNVAEWIRQNAGPLPASKMPNRVAIAVDHIVRISNGNLTRP